MSEAEWGGTCGKEGSLRNDLAVTWDFILRAEEPRELAGG